MSTYEPHNKERFERMQRTFSEAGDEDTLRMLSVMYILDMTYSRDDIAMAVKLREREFHRLPGSDPQRG